MKTDTGEVWFEIQYSRVGADDWFSGSSSDTIELARRKLTEPQYSGFDHRIVKKTLTEEVVQ